MGFVAAYSADSGGSLSSTVTIPTFATTGTNRNLYIAISKRFSNSTTVQSIVRGSDTFVKVAGKTTQGGMDMELWRSTNEPQTATASLTVTLTGDHGTWTVVALVVDDSHQTTRIGNVSLNPDASTGSGFDGVAFSSAVGRLVADFVAVEALAISSVAGATQTLRKQETIGAISMDMACSTAPGAASVDMDWTIAAGTDDFVHYVFEVLPSATPPTVTIPTGYLATNNLGPRTISQMRSPTPDNISVTEGTSPITLVTFTCTLGKGTMTMTASGSSAVSGNGTNAISIIGGSETDINNTLATFAFTGLEPTRENVTVAVLATDGTLNDTANLVLFNHRTSLTIVADSYADLVAMIQTAKMILPEGSTTGDVEILAEDDDTLTDTQTITLFVPSGTGGGGFLLQFRRRRRQ